MHLVVVGGSDAGTEAALTARSIDASVEITVLVADEYINYSVCGLPFLVSGEVPTWQQLAHRTLDEITGRGIDVRLLHEVESIEPAAGRATFRSSGLLGSLAYDRLILATGARPRLPSLDGIDNERVFALHTMADGRRLRDFLDQRRPTDAVVVGTGYIGVELADALVHRGVHVTLLGRARSVLPTLHPELGSIVQAELQANGVRVMSAADVESIDSSTEALTVRLGGDRTVSGAIVVIGTGVRPNTELGAAIGIPTGVAGALRVERTMETSVPNVFAAGDCVETWHALLERPSYLPLGTTSHKQGRVAGTNAVGGSAEFRGSLGTQVVKVFGLAAARTGLSDREAMNAGFDPLSSILIVPDHKRYYPRATDLTIRVTGDRRTGRLLGAEIVGDWRAEVAKRIDVFATAIHAAMRIDEIESLDLSYTPPVSAPWDPIQAASHAWTSVAP